MEKEEEEKDNSELWSVQEEEEEEVQDSSGFRHVEKEKVQHITNCVEVEDGNFEF